MPITISVIATKKNIVVSINLLLHLQADFRCNSYEKRANLLHQCNKL